ncbi:hypothetical protein GF378_00080 [Candidatus Pacearchaeota archaeon]|nr:hypothetical protein [Candidatus Pacearchaeota archaeon]
MAEVCFKFDKEKDLFNIWDTCNYKTVLQDVSKGIPLKIIKLCKGNNFEEIKEKISKELKIIHSSPLIPVIVQSANNSWKKIQNDFFNKLEQITNKKFPNKKITGYLTTVGRCPYSFKESWFMFRFFDSIPGILKTTAHELMHLFFHEYYWDDIEKQVGKEKTNDLKEALTVLLNLEFRHFWFVKDKGYSKHEKLRLFIEDNWKKQKDFDVLLKRCVNYLNKNDKQTSFSTI